eukprot:CAMPEP_0172175562 /NCGR_PEP_ID=MMETSP1050-20130122/14301_1 /TAXON_ID=233186 /ORGANISM="Cryptomonas curvata, Strain CCAP979/52" /LENGTH=606 /DNA_ID=CAMNT_0012847687 /DNA_START=23 /DNA_END=1843 /DNA_ORIENTATION=-
MTTINVNSIAIATMQRSISRRNVAPRETFATVYNTWQSLTDKPVAEINQEDLMAFFCAICEIDGVKEPKNEVFSVMYNVFLHIRIFDPDAAAFRQLCVQILSGLVQGFAESNTGPALENCRALLNGLNTQDFARWGDGGVMHVPRTYRFDKNGNVETATPPQPAHHAPTAGYPTYPAPMGGYPAYPAPMGGQGGYPAYPAPMGGQGGYPAYPAPMGGQGGYPAYPAPMGGQGGYPAYPAPMGGQGGYPAYPAPMGGQGGYPAYPAPMGGQGGYPAYPAPMGGQGGHPAYPAPMGGQGGYPAYPAPMGGQGGHPAYPAPMGGQGGYPAYPAPMGGQGGHPAYPAPMGGQGGYPAYPAPMGGQGGHPAYLASAGKRPHSPDPSDYTSLVPNHALVNRKTGQTVDQFLMSSNYLQKIVKTINENALTTQKLTTELAETKVLAEEAKTQAGEAKTQAGEASGKANAVESAMLQNLEEKRARRTAKATEQAEERKKLKADQAAEKRKQDAEKKKNEERLQTALDLAAQANQGLVTLTKNSAASEARVARNAAAEMMAMMIANQEAIAKGLPPPSLAYANGAAGGADEEAGSAESSDEPLTKKGRGGGKGKK